jgi:6-phosphogluconolactonase
MKAIYASVARRAFTGLTTPCLRHLRRAACFSLVLVGLQFSGTSIAQAGGVMFLNANAESNEVWMLKRANNGQVSLAGTFSTQGAGSGLIELASQNSIALTSDAKFLYVANALSNDITAFQVKRTGLRFVARVPSGGTFPNSVAVFGNLLYVLNAQGSAANITGYTIQNNGAPVAIPNSTRPVTAVPIPTQVGFTPDGATLIVTGKGANNIDTYAIGAGGLATGPTVQHSAGGSPFGFAFDSAGHVVISEIINSAASSYSWAGGVLQAITAHLSDFGKAACWTVITTTPLFRDNMPTSRIRIPIRCRGTPLRPTAASHWSTLTVRPPS